MKISAVHLRGYIEYARIKGIDHANILDNIGVTYQDLGNPHVKIKASTFCRTISEIGTALGDDMLGLHVGQHLNLNTLGVVYKISLQAKSLMECLYYCHDFLGNTFPIISIRHLKTGNGQMFRIDVDCADDNVRRYVSETTLTVMSREIFYASDGEASTVMYSPRKGAGYPEQWRIGDHYAISFTNYRKIGSRIGTSGLDTLIPAYLGLIEEFSSKNSFLSNVKISALMLSNPVLPDLDTISFNLNMATRTLQRKLTKEGSSYREISEELKRKISLLLLRHPDFSVADISTILGYSEPASYIHSFVKWHGRSPSEVRNKLSTKI